MHVEETNLIAAANDWLARTQAAAIQLPLGDGKSLYMGSAADIARMLTDLSGPAVRGEAAPKFTYKGADGRFLDSGEWWVENSEIGNHMALPILRDGKAIALVFSEAYDGCKEEIEENCRLLCSAGNIAGARGEELAPTDDQVHDAVRAFVNAGKRGADMAEAIRAALIDGARAPDLRGAGVREAMPEPMTDEKIFEIAEAFQFSYKGNPHKMSFSRAGFTKAVRAILSRSVSPRAADAPSEPSELRQALIDLHHAIQFAHDSLGGGIHKMPTMMHEEGTVTEFIEKVLAKSRAADALDSQPTLPDGWELVRAGDNIHLKRADGRWCGYSQVPESPAHRMTYEFLDDLLNASSQPTDCGVRNG